MLSFVFYSNTFRTLSGRGFLLIPPLDHGVCHLVHGGMVILRSPCNNTATLLNFRSVVPFFSNHYPRTIPDPVFSKGTKVA